MNTTWTLPDRPLSVKEIDVEARKFEFNSLVGLKQWLRAADTLLRQVRMLSAAASSRLPFPANKSGHHRATCTPEKAT